MSLVHPTALVDPAAELDSSVSVGPYTVIGPRVKVGAGTSIGPHCVIEGHTTIGRDNRIFQFNSIGAMPQDMSHRGEPTELHIGDRNTIREFCTFNTGTRKEDGVTRVGSDNWVMAYVHVAHDVRLGISDGSMTTTALALWSRDRRGDTLPLELMVHRRLLHDDARGVREPLNETRHLRVDRQVHRGEEEILLKPQEYRVLEYLMRHAGQVITRTMLLENVWDYHFDPQTNVIDVHMSRLRAKIDKAPWAPLIHTVRGAGYSLRE